MIARAGDVVANRFEIIATAGEGGMGTVYQARDRLSGELCALKLLHPQAPTAGDAERFAREAQLLSELRHPGIVGHIAHGRTEYNQRFLAMEWLEGQDLAQRLAVGRLPLAATVRLIQRVSEALAFAHSHDVLHRDLKPTNLFLPGGDVERVKILDFGIARRLAGSRAMTRTGMIIGTPEYMAPEQARGVKALTPAVDIFSLGCVFYECLSGEPPFIADQIAAVLVRILFEEPTPVAQRCAGLPDAIGVLLSQMLAKDPKLRRPSASEVAATLADILETTDLRIVNSTSAPTAAMPAVTEDEQELVSLVLALPARSAEEAAASAVAEERSDEREQPVTLLAELSALEVQADVLLSGAMVITVPQIGSARDQAARAARCAVTVKEHWPSARVVVVTGRGARSGGLLSGEALDRAWRLLSRPETPAEGGAASPPQTILVDEVSAGLLESRFELGPLPALAGGFVLGGEKFDEDTERRLLGKPTPCVGRERELSALESALQECQEDLLSRAMLVLGQPGLGKSRLRHEFLRRLESREEKVVLLSSRGDPLKTKSPYWLLGEAVRRRLELSDGQDVAEQRARLWERIGSRISTSPADAQRVTVFMGELCGVPFPDDDNAQLRAARQDPRLMGDQIEQAWLDALRLLRGEDPTLLVLEDLHWSDAPTIKLVEATLRRIRDTPFMVLALARPEVLELYPNLWAGAVQLLPLHPLARKASERLVRQILGPDLAAEQLTRIVNQSAGNPLFLEELIRAAAERKSGELPETVLAMIQARIGRLAAVTRRALRAASVLGETFWENGVLQLLSTTHGAVTIRGALEELQAEEIIEKMTERRFAAEPQYRFRHTLVRDAAYGLVNAEESRSWHAAAAAFLDRAGERNAFVLAEHYRLGMEQAKAVHCYVRAAEQSYDACDSDATLVSVERGLACGATGVEQGSLLSMEIIVRLWQDRFQDIVNLSPKALALLPPGSKPWCQVFEALFPAVTFSQPSALPPLVGQFISVEPLPEARPPYVQAAVWLCIALSLVGQKEAAQLLLNRVRYVTATLTDRDQLALGYVWGAESNFCEQVLKMPYQNLVCNQKSWNALERAGHHRIMPLEGAYLGKALFDMGRKDEARQVLVSNLTMGEHFNDATQLAYARVYLGRLYVQSADPAEWDKAERLASAVVGIQNLSMGGLARGVLAHAALRRGDLQTADTEARQACELLSAFPSYRVEIAALWSQILSAQENFARALEVSEQMLEQIDKLGMEPYGMIELLGTLAAERERAGLLDKARQAVARGLDILRRHLDDMPEAEMRATYLRALPSNVRLLELAATLATPEDLASVEQRAKGPGPTA